MARYQINCKKYPLPELFADVKNSNIFASDIHTMQSAVKYTYKPYKSYKKQCGNTREKYIKYLAQQRLDSLSQNTKCMSTSAKELVANAKTRIEAYNLYWDRVKLLTNPFERIYMTCRKFISIPPHSQHMNISDIEPLSRSFFKMIEMASQYLQPLITANRPVNSLHLAEGPGGFIEAWLNLRNKHKPACSGSYQTINFLYQEDNAYAITLIDPAFEVPSWKRSIEFLRENPNVHIMSGADGTGNLYSIDNLRYLAKRLRYKKIELVTADGGFDFSVGYNTQEYLACKLIFAEIIGALAVLSPGGCFLCKFFDLNNKLTADMLYLLQCHFRLIDIIKPSTSRPANSEKYIICFGFHGISDEVFERLLGVLDQWNRIDADNETTVTELISLISANTKPGPTNMQFTVINGLFKETAGPPASFYAYVTQVNDKLIQTQVQNIDNTIDVIERKRFEDPDWLSTTLEHQAEMALKWCKRFGIPAHPTPGATY
jgi:23S rRNA U2552 (ribose-2'-O)-methylase RlmE/FtsJ